MEELTLLGRLKHFEEAQLKMKDEYGAELLRNAQIEIERLRGQVRVHNQVSLATIPKLYKNPSCYTKNGDRICNIFYDNKPGYLAFEIHGEHADVVAQSIIEMQG